MKRIKFVLLFLLIAATFIALPARAQSINTDPPPQPVKLIFIHHSTGENWLTDGYGNLGRELAANNYFVSDTNYGWGPDGIGDRTDIPDWLEWFTSPKSSDYTQALYRESGQNAAYTRLFADPGGENQIVLFKSCFPNSALEGSPNDSPDPEWGFTVGHAKYVYNSILAYFRTRPDKLFIVITAPPLQDSTYADNARAFNNWLVDDWLDENNYPLDNVAVFDFYNVLTHPDNHHRVIDGQIEHLSNGVNTLYYDSEGDDHPNPEGSQKATAEFIPLLNFYYHRWLNANPQTASPPEMEPQTPPEATSPPVSASPPAAEPANPALPGVIDDFDSGAPAGTEGWAAFTDRENPDTTLSCGVDSSVAQAGSGSLRIDFYVEPESWATCALFYDSILNWSNAEGIAFRYRADAPGRVFAVTLHAGTPDNSTSYQYLVETAPESVEGWAPVELAWRQILGVEWERDVNNPIDPAGITGISFGFDADEGAPSSGTLWVDSLIRWSAAEQAERPVGGPGAEIPAGDTGEQPQSEAEAPAQGNGLPCKGVSALSAAILLGALWSSTKKRQR